MSDFTSILGSLAGGAAGTAIAPGAGTMIGSQLGGKIGGSIGSGSSGSSGSGQSGGGQSGAGGTGLSLASGLLQTIQANNLKHKADASFPELVDPNQSAYLAELNQKRKSIETGADAAGALQAADQSQANASNSIVNASGGDAGATIQGLLQAQNVAGTTKNKALADDQAQQFAYTGAYGHMLDQVSGRKLQLQLLRNNQFMAQYAREKQTANQNLSAGAGRLLSGIQPGMGGGQESTPNANGLDSSQMSQLTPSLGNSVPESAAPFVVPQQNLATLGQGTLLSLGL